MKKPSFWSTLFALLAYVLLCRLGFWQIERLHWKERVLADLATAYAVENPPLMSFGTLRNMAIFQVMDSAHFEFGCVRGRFLDEYAMKVVPRTWNGAVGYHLVVPFLLESGEGSILVNRGWVPSDMKAFPGSETKSCGLLRLPERPNIFSPSNDPAKDQWYRIEPKTMKNVAQFRHGRGTGTFAPVVMYETGTDRPGVFPVRAALRWTPPNDHLGYAVFWFSMIPVLLAIYWIRFIKRA